MSHSCVSVLFFRAQNRIDFINRSKMWAQNTHTDEFMISLCLEILLQFTHEEKKECYVKQNNVKQYFQKSFMELLILHKMSYTSGFCFMPFDDIEGFMCIRKKPHALENGTSCFTVTQIQCVWRGN